MLIVHTSDLHIGISRYSESPIYRAYLDVLEEISLKTIESKVKYLVVSGDMFHTTDPSYEPTLEVVRILKKLRESGVRVVVVPGNHDNSPTRKSILYLLAEAGLIHLLDYDELYDYLVVKPAVYDEVVFYGIPGFRGSKEVEYVKSGLLKFKDLKTYEKSEIIVVAHISAKVYEYDPSKYFSRYGKLSTDEGELLRKTPATARYVALGHIHIPLPLERKFKAKMAYPGAPIGMDANDLRETAILLEKGFKRRILLVDTSSEPPEVTSIDLENAPYVKLVRIEASTPDEVVERVKVALQDMPSQGHRALLAYVEGMERLDPRLLAIIRSLSIKNNVHIEVHLVRKEELLSIPLLEDVFEEIHTLEFEDIEERVLKELISKSSVQLDFAKLKWLLNKLSEPVPDSKLGELLQELKRELD